LKYVIAELTFYGGWSFLVGMLIVLPIFWRITTKYFNNKLGFKYIYNPLGNDKLLIGMCSIQYATLIVFRRGAKKSIDRAIFKDIDFREKARKKDKLLAFTFVVLTYGGLLMVIIAVILNFIKNHI
jgi:hypothetical protein